MVFKRQDGDIVLARFVISGDDHNEFKNSGDIRFIKRRGKFYQINDIIIYKMNRRSEHSMVSKHKEDTSIIEITPDKIIELINAALNATMNWTGEGETYEIWVNDYIRKELGV